MSKHAIADINNCLAERMMELVRALLGIEPTSTSRTEWRFRTRGSLAICMVGPKRGMWRDHEAGVGGDPLGLVSHLLRTGMRDAFAWAMAWLGQSPVQVHPAAQVQQVHTLDADKNWSKNLAFSTWGEAVAPENTPAEVYLRTRKLVLPECAALRFHPRAWRKNGNGPPGPAMVALMTTPNGNVPVGVHITYLQPDGMGKADGLSNKIMLGNTGIIRLVDDAEVTMGLGLAEGIETALAIMQRTGWCPVWAATSAGAMAKFPVLGGIEALTLFADTDTNGTGLQAAHTCAAWWAEAGRKVHIIRPPAGDWDDATKGAA